MARLETKAESAFDVVYDQHKYAIGQLKEKERVRYERLRLGTAKPVELEWRLPERIQFTERANEGPRKRHLYPEEDGGFRADLGTWEAELLAEELVNTEVVGWLRNLDRKPWSLEIPYESGGEVRPMFPDLLVVCQTGTATPSTSWSRTIRVERTISRRPSVWRASPRSMAIASRASSSSANNRPRRVATAMSGLNSTARRSARR